jgi:hypothetical protein
MRYCLSNDKISGKIVNILTESLVFLFQILVLVKLFTLNRKQDYRMNDNPVPEKSKNLQTIF